MKRGYAKADRSVQNFSARYPGSKIKPNVLVLHTTEGMTWPDYAGGSTAPTYTVLPVMSNKSTRWRQHFDEDESARALRNASGGVETNTLNCIQLEMIGTCSLGVASSWEARGYRRNVDFIFWPFAPDWALAGIADFIADLHKRLGIKLEAAAPNPWPGYPNSTTAARMSGTAWRNFYGVCGHMHVPENSHGDPGAFPIRRVLSLAGDAKKTRVAKARSRMQDVVTELNDIANDLADVPDGRKRIHKWASDISMSAKELNERMKGLPES